MNLLCHYDACYKYPFLLFWRLTKNEKFFSKEIRLSKEHIMRKPVDKKMFINAVKKLLNQ
jgi:hypothetical protein